MDPNANITVELIESPPENKYNPYTETTNVKIEFEGENTYITEEIKVLREVKIGRNHVITLIPTIINDEDHLFIINVNNNELKSLGKKIKMTINHFKYTVKSED